MRVEPVSAPYTPVSTSLHSRSSWLDPTNGPVNPVQNSGTYSTMYVVHTFQMWN